MFRDKKILLNQSSSFLVIKVQSSLYKMKKGQANEMKSSVKEAIYKDLATIDWVDAECYFDIAYQNCMQQKKKKLFLFKNKMNIE